VIVNLYYRNKAIYVRIIQLDSFFQPKLGYEVTHLSRKLLEQGHEILVITSDRYFPFQNYNEIYLEILGERNSPLRGYNIECGIPVFRIKPLIAFDTSILLPSIIDIIKKFKPDIIHIHGLFNPLTVQTLIRLRKYNHITIVIDEHMIPFFETISFGTIIKKVYLKFISHLLIKKLMKNVFSIYSTKEEVAKFIIRKRIKISEIIPIGVDTNKFKNNQNIRKDLRQKLKLSNKFVLFYSGKIVASKNIHEILFFVAELYKMYQVGFIMVGNGPKLYIEKLFQLIKKLEIEDICQHIPFVSQEKLPDLMNIGDLGIWIGETPSASINEFISFGKPILVKNFEGYNLEKKGFKFIKKHNNREDSINWISDMISNPDNYTKICNEARNYALNNLDWKVNIKKLFDRHYIKK